MNYKKALNKLVVKQKINQSEITTMKKEYISFCYIFQNKDKEKVFMETIKRGRLHDKQTNRGQQYKDF